MDTSYESEFDAWWYEECGIAAAEIVGSNSYEYDSLHMRFYEDEVRRAAAEIGKLRQDFK